MAGEKSTAQREDAHFRVLRLVESNPSVSQREMAKTLGLSLGAVNYCIHALVEKGHIKLTNFVAAEKKLGYIYVLTPEGVAHRANLAVKFIERKLIEYHALKAELEQIQGEFPEDTRVSPVSPENPESRA